MTAMVNARLKIGDGFFNKRMILSTYMEKSNREIFRFQWRILILLLTWGVGSLISPAPAEARRKHRPARKSYPAIRDIIITPKNVFDPNVPGEGHWPYTWANVIHFTTHQDVVRRELLVKPGEPADQEKLDESERILRSLPFIKEATIKTVPTNDGRVDVVVETQDGWTTQPQIDFATAGEKNHFAAGLLEENLLGYGKSVSYFYSDNDLTGISHQYGYSDPQLFGTRAQLTSLFDDTETGNEQHLTLANPFYSLATPYAAGSSWNHILGDQKVFQGGIQTNDYTLDHNDADTYIGARINKDPLSVHRLALHYQYYSDYYTNSPTTTPGTLPDNKTISNPGVAWNWIQSNYIKETFADRAERVEDTNLGHQTGASVGYAARIFGSTDDTIPFSASDQFGFGTEGDHFTLISYGLVGRLSSYAPRQVGGRLDNNLYFANANYYAHLPTEFPFTGVVHYESGYLQNPDSQNQLQLGGDTGLRGFKSNSFTGNKSMLLNIEGRAYYPHEILHLAYVGGTCFVDAGQVQPEGLPYTAKDVHVDVGLGFRIGLTRSTAGSVYRLDVAYAIGPIQQGNRFVVSIATGQGFHRAANTFGNIPGLPISQD
jgi:outer membrane protein assembly factor BamA